jgi:hypothetical protein
MAIRKSLKQTRIRAKGTNFKQSKITSISRSNSTGDVNKFMEITSSNSLIGSKKRRRCIYLWYNVFTLTTIGFIMSSSIMYTLYDSKAEFYSAPFFAPNETVATRDFHKLNLEPWERLKLERSI